MTKLKVDKEELFHKSQEKTRKKLPEPTQARPMKVPGDSQISTSTKE